MKTQHAKPITVSLTDIALMIDIVNTLIDAWRHEIELPPPVTLNVKGNTSKGSVPLLMSNSAYRSSQVVHLLRSLTHNKQ